MDTHKNIKLLEESGEIIELLGPEKSLDLYSSILLFIESEHDLSVSKSYLEGQIAILKTFVANKRREDYRLEMLALRNEFKEFSLQWSNDRKEFRLDLRNKFWIIMAILSAGFGINIIAILYK